jgi:ATP-dependent Clp protease ATP-binding subunit ClpA
MHSSLFSRSSYSHDLSNPIYDYLKGDLSANQACAKEFIEREIALTATLKKAIGKLLTENPEISITEIIEKITPLLDDVILVSSKTQTSPKDLIDTSKKFLEIAKEDLSKAKNSFPAKVSREVKNVLNALIQVLESFIHAFGFGDFFSPAKSKLEADFKSNKILTLLSLFGMISTIVIPLVGPTLGALILGGFFLTLGALSLIYPLIKRAPENLPGRAINLTKQAIEKPTIHEGRNELLDQIADILSQKTHVMLTGPSRVGKTTLTKALAAAIASGKYPALKGKKVFHINTAKLASEKPSFMGGSFETLHNISEVMGKDRDNIILVLDEIHNACKTNQELADNLKTLLDEGGEFPRVIGITTGEDLWRDMLENTAFLKRFRQIPVEAMSQAETIRVLAKIGSNHNEKPLLGPQTLEHIYEVSAQGHLPQPKAAIDLLNECIRMVSPGSKGTITQAQIYEVTKPTVDELLTSPDLNQMAEQLRCVEFESPQYAPLQSSINPLERLKQSYLSLEERMLQTMKKVAKISMPVLQYRTGELNKHTFEKQETSCLSELWLIGSILRPTILETMLTLQGQTTDFRHGVIDRTVIGNAARNLAYTDSSY